MIFFLRKKLLCEGYQFGVLELIATAHHRGVRGWEIGMIFALTYDLHVGSQSKVQTGSVFLLPLSLRRWFDFREKIREKERKLRSGKEWASRKKNSPMSTDKTSRKVSRDSL